MNQAKFAQQGIYLTQHYIQRGDSRGRLSKSGFGNRPVGLVGPLLCRFLDGGMRSPAPYRSGPSRDWIKVKNPDSRAMIRAREGDWS
jgi:hypothetical protein